MQKIVYMGKVKDFNLFLRTISECYNPSIKLLYIPSISFIDYKSIRGWLVYFFFPTNAIITLVSASLFDYILDGIESRVFFVSF